MTKRNLLLVQGGGPTQVLNATLVAVVEEALARGWAAVVVAEGIRDRSGSFIYQVKDPAQSDALNRSLTGGVAQHLATKVAGKLKIRCRSEKPGLLGRSSMLHVSSQDLADAKLVGQAAVRGLLAGKTHKMVALLPLDNEEKTPVRIRAAGPGCGSGTAHPLRVAVRRRNPCERSFLSISESFGRRSTALLFAFYDLTGLYGRKDIDAGICNERHQSHPGYSKRL